MQHFFSGLVGKHVTVVTISRDDIERGNLDAALASLNKLEESKAALEASNGTISLLTSGYDQDRRKVAHNSRDAGLLPGTRCWLSLLVSCLHAHRTFAARVSS